MKLTKQQQEQILLLINNEIENDEDYLNDVVDEEKSYWIETIQELKELKQEVENAEKKY